jgi:chromosomal replication initiator protein
MQEWVRERFAGMLQSFISDELGYSVELEIVARPREKRELEEPTTVVATPQVVSQSTAFEPNPSFNFENFIVGDTNRLAFAGAKAVASEPGGTYNPLFIWGPSGLGKTHLLHAIATELRKNNPKISIAYISAQQFAEDFVLALQANRVEQFRRQHRDVKVWLLDDIQHLA